MDTPSILARVWDFIVAILGHWWVWITGVAFVLEQALGWLPKHWREWLDVHWPNDRRSTVFRYVLIIGIAVSAFQAFDDVSNRLRASNTKINELQAQLNEAPSQSEKEIASLRQQIDDLRSRLATADASRDLKIKGRHLASILSQLKSNVGVIAIDLKEITVGAEEDGEALSYAEEFAKFFESINVVCKGCTAVYLPMLGTPPLTIVFRGDHTPPLAVQLQNALVSGIDCRLGRRDDLPTAVGLFVGALK